MKYFIIFRIEGNFPSGEDQEKIEVDYPTYINLFENLRGKYPDRVQIRGKDVDPDMDHGVSDIPKQGYPNLAGIAQEKILQVQIGGIEMVNPDCCGWMTAKGYCLYDIEPPGRCKCPYDSIDECPVHNIDIRAEDVKENPSLFLYLLSISLSIHQTNGWKPDINQECKYRLPFGNQSKRNHT